MQNLIKEAMKAQVKAYAPYSGVKVGAAIITFNGRIFLGANVENASLSLTICAERVAAVNALLAGCMNWEALAIVFDGHISSPPCGACCQFLSEFNSGNLKIGWGTNEESFKVTQLNDLLTYPFKLKDLK